ncbi:hypothetical protein AWJ20_1293 [Sugiyamaella lignohabitans]|uniref:Uncharacterized protein n=1 Tax=Sugiyamaella lignohabitans TaxID=796027 RepID=A0A167DKL3_9ASCO|nr:uncharacterized protein AWJ20_1293 [Sugiyamaella lignohabitans]ANB13015.1 hypothetical protein AWJ20_1293 [Sugiyamaella lignohabitans]
MEDSRPSSVPRRPAHRRGLWQAGVLLFIASNLFGSSVQITTLPLIVLSPLQAIGLVFNSISASILLAEPFTKYSFIGTGLVSVGALIIAAFGAIPEPHHNLNELLVLLQRTQFLLWMGITLSLVILILVLIATGIVDEFLNGWEAIGGGGKMGLEEHTNESNNSRGVTPPRHVTARNSPLQSSIQNHNQYNNHTSSRGTGSNLDGHTDHREFPSYHVFLANKSLVVGGLYGVVAGILSAHSLLMAKSAVELVVRGLKDGWYDLFRWQTWLIVGCFLTFAILQLYYLNCGLTLCSTSVLYPLVFCVYNIITIMNGLIYFRQTASLSFVRIVLIAFGTFLVLAGVLCLSWRLNDSQAPNLAASTSAATNTATTSRRHLFSPSHGRSRSNNSAIYEEPSTGSETEQTPLLFFQQHRKSPLRYGSLGLVTKQLSTSGSAESGAQSSSLNSTANGDDEHPEYTSFRTITVGDGIPEPASPYSNRKTTLRRGRTLSQEQSEILDQLRQK